MILGPTIACPVVAPLIGTISWMYCRPIPVRQRMSCTPIIALKHLGFIGTTDGNLVFARAPSYEKSYKTKKALYNKP